MIPTLMANVILGAILGVPYSIWNKRKLASVHPSLNGLHLMRSVYW
ncbi:hypothetical protein PL9214290215 [Planktothrix tepida PCC 9214]|uniref:Uncharacterized protein n=1 Tax=Planktothrix tepida PCC 9214 TaxID=671072 RepID=A0A1J1LGC4_9CYAN|nr:hypothetical protein PL9214290215 [Planktothrix tepida PCC 9214]